MTKSIKERMMEQEQEAEKVARDSYENRKGSSGMYGNILKPNPPVQVINLKTDKEHTFDIIPYFAGPNDTKYKQGQLVYKYECSVHKRVGPTEDDILCMTETYKKPCYICERKKKVIASLPPGIDRQSDEWRKLVGPLNASRRCWYYIICFDPGEEEKGVQLVDLSQYNFDSFLSAAIRVPGRHGEPDGFRKFWLPNNNHGKTISCVFEGLYKKTTSLNFLDRNYDIDDKVLEFTSEHPIDTLVHFPEYDEVRELFLSGCGDDEEKSKTHSVPEKVEEPSQKQEENSSGFCSGFGKETMQRDECGDCVLLEKCTEALNSNQASNTEDDIPF